MVPNNSERVPIGMIHGRFHPFHVGHLSYANLTWAHCDFLVVGITNPDPRHRKQLPGDESRHLAGSNPFSFFERYLMIQGSLVELGLRSGEFAIIPFAIDCPEIWPHYLPSEVVHFLRDRGEWTRTKMQTLNEAGHQAYLIEDSELLDVEGTEVRRRLAAGSDWRSLVPSATAKVLTDIGAEQRLNTLGPK